MDFLLVILVILNRKLSNSYNYTNNYENFFFTRILFDITMQNNLKTKGHCLENKIYGPCKLYYRAR